MLVLTPATLLGTTTGVFFNKMSPNWLIMLLLVALCAVTGKRTLAKARSTYDKETRAMQTVYSAVPTKEEEALALKRDENESPVNARAAPGTRDPLLEQIVAEESKFPWGTAFSLLRTWLVVFGMALLKGEPTKHHRLHAHARAAAPPPPCARRRPRRALAHRRLVRHARLLGGRPAQRARAHRPHRAGGA